MSVRDLASNKQRIIKGLLAVTKALLFRANPHLSVTPQPQMTPPPPAHQAALSPGIPDFAPLDAGRLQPVFSRRSILTRTRKKSASTAVKRGSPIRDPNRGHGRPDEEEAWQEAREGPSEKKGNRIRLAMQVSTRLAP